MIGSFIIIRANGGRSQREIIKPPELEELQRGVGGYIELVYRRAGECMFVNEEGKLHGLPYNYEATAMAMLRGDFIVGDAVVIRGDAELMAEL